MQILLNNIKRNLKIFFDKIKSFEINTNICIFTLIYSLFTTIAFNINFFRSVYEIDKSVISVVIAYIIIHCIYNVLFTLIFQRKITKK